jgi:hypothetical protein
MQVSKKPGAARLFAVLMIEAFAGVEIGEDWENNSGMRVAPRVRTTNIAVRVFIKADKVIFRDTKVKVLRVS